MVTSPTPESVDLDRTRRLFEYISKIALLQSTVVSDIKAATSYEEIVWLGSLPDAGEVQSAVRGDPGTKGEWLLVKRPRFAPPPLVPDELLPWLDPGRVRDSGRALVLNATATEEREVDAPDGGTETRFVVIDLADAPDVAEEFEQYLPRWTTWAEEDRRLQPIQEVYSSLFAIQQRAASLGELYEVVVGVGLATLRRGHTTVRRHLLVARAGIEMDPESGRITVGPAGDGLALHFEPDMLEADESPPPDIIRSLSERLVDIDDPLAPGMSAPALQAWTHGSGEDARYDDSAVEPATIEPRLVVTYAPAIILRRRSRRAIADFCRAVVDGIGPETVIPGAIRDLIERTDDSADPNGTEGDSGPSEVEALFPLPANEEQQQIISRLDRAPGIVVEGPPGTGKSHTIANLIAHLTASGQRVLVTSHTARALTVVKGKLPAGISDLCVDVIGEGKERRDNLERSINALLARQTDPEWESRRILERLERFRGWRSELEKRRTLLIAEQRAARELEVTEHAPGIGDYTGTLSDIARRVVRDEARYGWLDEGGVGPPPDALALLPDLLLAERSLTPKHRELARLAVPDTSELPSPTAVRDALDAIERLQGRVVEPVGRSVRQLAEAVPDVRARLTAAVTALATATRAAGQSPAPWAGPAVNDILSGNAPAWKAIDEATTNALGRLDPALDDLDRTAVFGISSENVGRIRLQAEGLRAHLAAGGHLSRLGRRPPPVQDADELLRVVRVDGKRPDTEPGLSLLLRWIAAQEVIRSLEAGWAGRLPPSNGTLKGRRDAILVALEQLRLVLRVDAARSEAVEAVSAISPLLVPDWRSPSAVTALLDDADRADVIARLEQSRVILKDRLRPLRDAILEPDCPAIVKESLESALAGDVARYAATLTELRAISDAQARVAARDRLASVVGQVLPAMASAIAADPADARWDRYAVELQDAWEWRRARAWLVEVRRVRPDREIAAELATVENRIRHLVGEITENLAWQHTLRSLSAFAQSNLRAYQAKMRSYGRGTGIHAQRHLAEARRYLEACQDAVPVWIMPTHLVAETIKAKPAAFDVVIVDEASQSGVDASFLMWLGRKLVVVGDEKQISPDMVGIDRTAAILHAETYLHDFHFASVMGVDNSLFTQASVRYRSPIRLREHFRCMPEIIEFSNSIAYADVPLIPLRQYGTDRLEPLVARYVEGAETRSLGGSKVNDREAEAIVATIERLCKDPAYDGKTMGVISLLGSQQARRINDLLVRILPPSEITERKLVCGDAYAFQGDERDVIFLSMVAAPEADGTRLRSVSERTFNQRYNVAASRAKDQEWLFHSVTLRDLRPEDLRHRLVSHFVAPTVEDVIDELADVPDDEVIEPFDSVFEQRVFKAIRARGYRVTPQVPIHGYRIDLVITGRERKLAVECDGDRWHGPEEYAKDQGRQRDLERCGWTFVRVRGSEYFSDPIPALAPLWAELERLGIHPWEPREETVHDLDGTPVVVEAMTVDAPLSPAEASTEDEEDGVPQPMGAADLTPIHQLDQPPLLPDEGSIWATGATGSASAVEPARPISVSTTPDESGFAEEIAGAPEEGESLIGRYTAWAPAGPIPHPGTQLATTATLAGLVVDVVRAEGPIGVDLLYSRIVRASGGQRVTRASRRELNLALSLAMRKGWVIARDPFKGPGLGGQVVRLPSMGPILIRERGDRDLREIPPDEVAAVSRVLGRQSGHQPGEALKRGVLEFYGRTRLTEAASTFLDLCFRLFGEDAVRAEADRLSAVLRSSGVSVVVPTPSSGPADIGPVEVIEAAARPVVVPNAPEVPAPVVETDSEDDWEGPPFWEVVNDVARFAGTFSGRYQQAIVALWREIDGTSEVDEVRQAAQRLGAERDWASVARVMAGNLAGTAPEFRGAATDVAYARFWQEHASAGGPHPATTPGIGRLLATFDSAEAEARRVGPRTGTQGTCIHGATKGRCLYIACRNHATGGIDTATG